jgi:hypothetical protein
VDERTIGAAPGTGRRQPAVARSRRGPRWILLLDVGILLSLLTVAVSLATLGHRAPALPTDSAAQRPPQAISVGPRLQVSTASRSQVAPVQLLSAGDRAWDADAGDPAPRADRLATR